MKVIMTISDRIHSINHGQTIAQGTPQEVAEPQRSSRPTWGPTCLR